MLKIKYMQKLATFILAALALILSLGSCQDDNKGEQKSEVSLVFRSTFGGQPLVMYDPAYDYVEGIRMKAQLFQFYLSDIELVAANGEKIKLSDIELINFGDDNNSQQAAEGYVLRFKDIPGGQYSRIQFGLGVSPDLNATQPGNYAPTHPLADNYWSWALGYVFSKIEGNADVNGDGAFNDKLTYHTGADALYQVLSYDGPFMVPVDGSDYQVEFDVDLKNVLVNGNNFVDFRIAEDTQDHTNDPALYNFIWNNLAQAIQVRR